MVPPSLRDSVKYGMLGGERGWKVSSLSLDRLHMKYEPPNIPRTLSKVWCNGCWSKGLLEFCFFSKKNKCSQISTNAIIWNYNKCKDSKFQQYQQILTSMTRSNKLRPNVFSKQCNIQDCRGSFVLKYSKILVSFTFDNVSHIQSKNIKK